MMQPPDITDLLERASCGNDEAVNTLFPLLYQELRQLAEHHMKVEHPDHTLQATALVHEAYLRLLGQRKVIWKNRAHFMALASQAIRRILVDHARRKASKKRTPSGECLTIDHELVYQDAHATDLVALNDALTQFADEYPEKARVVEMRFFGGLTSEEIGVVLDRTARTVERHWQFARAWLFRKLNDDGITQA